MESLGYIEHFAPQAGAKLEVFGDIQLRQKEPLGHKGLDTRYNVHVAQMGSLFSLLFGYPLVLGDIVNYKLCKQ